MSYNLNQTPKYTILRSTCSPITTNISTYSFQQNSHIISTIDQIITPKIHIIQKNVLLKFKHLPNQQYLSQQMVIFVNHCATIIQSYFRGYQQRKYYRLFKPLLHRFKELLSALVDGWKVRKIMKTNYIVKKCQKIKQYTNKQHLRQARISKRQLIEDINLMQHKGNWITYHQNGLKKKQKSKITNIKLALGSKTPITDKKDQNKNSNLPKFPQKHLPNQQIPDNQHHQQTIPKQQQKQTQHSSQQQIPIKANGFYQMPNSPFQNQQKNKDINHNKNNKVVKLINKKQVKSKQKESQENFININNHDKITGNQNCDKKDVSNYRKKEEVSTLSLTTDLPMEHPTVQQEILIPNKKIKIQWIKQHLNNFQPNIPVLPNDIKQETQKLKKNPKGIKVTLSTNSLKDYPNISKKQQKNIPQMDIIKSKDELSQIMQVYSNAYTNKNIEITNKINQLKTKRKFVS